MASSGTAEWELYSSSSSDDVDAAFKREAAEQMRQRKKWWIAAIEEKKRLTESNKEYLERVCGFTIEDDSIAEVTDREALEIVRPLFRRLQREMRENKVRSYRYKLPVTLYCFIVQQRSNIIASLAHILYFISFCHNVTMDEAGLSLHAD